MSYVAQKGTVPSSRKYSLPLVRGLKLAGSSKFSNHIIIKLVSKNAAKADSSLYTYYLVND